MMIALVLVIMDFDTSRSEFIRMKLAAYQCPTESLGTESYLNP